MTSNTENLFVERTLKGHQSEHVTLLAAVEMPSEDHLRRVTLFFSKTTDVNHVIIRSPWDIAASTTVDGALKIDVTSDSDGPVALTLDGHDVDIDPQVPEFDLLKGDNVALSVQNGETAPDIADWLEFHIREQGLTAAVIFYRADPAKVPAFAANLKREIAQRGVQVNIICLSADTPFGNPDMPPEWHPYSTPGAPGKDRMTIPPSNPWRSAMSEVHFFEISRHLFLNKARAVTNIDVIDLVFNDQQGSVFDRAAQSPAGVITLLGRHCYPWRVRNDMPPRFGDHVCIQFDKGVSARRWCVAPDKIPTDTTWKFIRIRGTSATLRDFGQFGRFMALRYRSDKVSKIVPKTSLIEHPELVKLANDAFDHKPVRMPDVQEPQTPKGSKGLTSIVTTMKNEGPFILEWLAYHRVIGVKGFLVYTNDCTDGTDTFLDLLQDKGYVQHRDNPFKGTDLKPQHAALQAAEEEPLIRDAEWAICMDVDEYINIKTGDGTLDALYKAVGDANMISCTWRLFGNADVHEFKDSPIIEQFNRCAEELTRKPHQAWGFKTLFKNLGIFKKLGVHRPKGLIPQHWSKINWINGSGAEIPKEMFRNAWRSTTETYGYDLVQLNHYAVRSAESFLVKRDRGRVNHVDRDQGLAYWFRMNNNSEREFSIQRMLPNLKEEMNTMLADPEIKAAHEACVKAHAEKIKELRKTENYTKFYKEITSERMERLSRLHHHFGANVFLAGPDSVTDEVAFGNFPRNFFYTVDQVKETQH